jgi:cytokinin riboside 5'-monophosphate phosphoribohydrolase
MNPWQINRVFKAVAVAAYSDLAEGNGAPKKAPRSLAVCVFCGARPGTSPIIKAAARHIGQLIGSRGHQLVYGAGGCGLMGEVAWSAWRSGAAITGYVPYFIYERERTIQAPQQQLYLTRNLFERKRYMMEHSDIFIALPGGYGTLDEVFEVLSHIYLDRGDKPLILLNTENFWNGLVALTQSLYNVGFADRGPESLYRVANSPEEAIRLAEEAAADLPAQLGGGADSGKPCADEPGRPVTDSLSQRPLPGPRISPEGARR